MIQAKSLVGGKRKEIRSEMSENLSGFSWWGIHVMR